MKLAPAISPVAHAILPVPHSGFPIPHAITPVTPPPGYLPPQEPKGQDGKIVNHQHELKITHEYIAPPISGNHQSHQPTATPRMVANSKGGGDRNVKRLPVIAGRGRVWSSGLCSFTDLCDTCGFLHYILLSLQLP